MAGQMGQAAPLVCYIDVLPNPLSMGSFFQPPVLQSTFSEVSVGQECQPPVPSTPLDLRSYDHILADIPG